jgi:hypothetical protein
MNRKTEAQIKEANTSTSIFDARGRMRKEPSELSIFARRIMIPMGKMVIMAVLGGIAGMLLLAPLCLLAGAGYQPLAGGWIAGTLIGAIVSVPVIAEMR